MAVVDTLWSLCTDSPTSGSRFFRASATLTDVGVADEASIEGFVHKVNIEFGAQTLSIDSILTMTDPSLGAIAALIEQTMHRRADAGPEKKPTPTPNILQPAIRSTGLLLLTALGVAQGSSCASTAPSHAAFTFQDFGAYKMVSAGPFWTTVRWSSA